MVVTMVAGLVLIAGGALTIWEARRSPPAVPAPAIATVSRPLTDELLGTTKALQATQQETIDQLQVVQDQLAAQKLETKKLADEIAEITEKLAVVQSNLPAASSTSVVLPKPHH
jgi:uncharacterized coiled-coil protein SlyX